MGHAVFGYAGKLCLAFPPQNGHTWDFRNFGMVETVRPWIEAGKLRIICADAIDEESWSNKDGDGRYRSEMQEKWFSYVVDELIPEYLEWGEKAMTTGCSMGGLHAANFFFRRPDIFDTLISLSGVFDATYFFGDYMDDIVYNNSPVHFIPNMPDDHPWLDLYRQGLIGSSLRKMSLTGRTSGALTSTTTGRGGRSSCRTLWDMFWGTYEQTS